MKIYDYAGKKNISGERIREARTRLHLTQTNLAVQLKLVGVDVERDSISRIEIGTRFVTSHPSGLRHGRNRVCPPMRPQSAAEPRSRFSRPSGCTA